MRCGLILPVQFSLHDMNAAYRDALEWVKWRTINGMTQLRRTMTTVDRGDAGSVPASFTIDDIYPPDICPRTGP